MHHILPGQKAGGYRRPHCLFYLSQSHEWVWLVFFCTHDFWAQLVEYSWPWARLCIVSNADVPGRSNLNDIPLFIFIPNLVPKISPSSHWSNLHYPQCHWIVCSSMFYATFEAYLWLVISRLQPGKVVRSTWLLTLWPVWTLKVSAFNCAYNSIVYRSVHIRTPCSTWLNL